MSDVLERPLLRERQRYIVPWDLDFSTREHFALGNRHGANILAVEGPEAACFLDIDVESTEEDAVVTVSELQELYVSALYVMAKVPDGKALMRPQQVYGTLEEAQKKGGFSGTVDFYVALDGPRLVVNARWDVSERGFRLFVTRASPGCQYQPLETRPVPLIATRI